MTDLRFVADRTEDGDPLVLDLASEPARVVVATVDDSQAARIAGFLNDVFLPPSHSTALRDSYTIEVEINDPEDEVTFEQLRIVIAAVIADRADFRRIVRVQGRKPLSGTEADVGDINFPPDQD